MHRTITGLALAAMALSACATTPVASAEATESIVYETGPCLGACAVFKVTVNRNGVGVFEGRRFTAATGEHRFTINPDQFRAFAAQLEPLRPASGEQR